MLKTEVITVFRKEDQVRKLLSKVKIVVVQLTSG